MERTCLSQAAADESDGSLGSSPHHRRCQVWLRSPLRSASCPQSSDQRPSVFVATTSTRNGSAGIPSCVFQPMHEAVPSSLFLTDPTSTKHRFLVTPAT